MAWKAAIIGGTGIGNRLLALPGRSLHIPTERGLMRARDLGEILVVSRHSAGHKTPPHRVHYAAIALGLRRAGVRACFSTAAVGALNPELAIGSLAVCSDVIDASARRVTLFDRTVQHTDFTFPFHPQAREALLAAASELGQRVRDGGVYVGVDGPRFESPAEIRMFHAWGGDYVGMTVSTEAELMAEAGVPYATLAVVTNAGAGLTERPPEHGEVGDVMHRESERIVRLLLRAAEKV